MLNMKKKKNKKKEDGIFVILIVGILDIQKHQFKMLNCILTFFHFYKKTNVINIYKFIVATHLNRIRT